MSTSVCTAAVVVFLLLLRKTRPQFPVFWGPHIVVPCPVPRLYDANVDWLLSRRLIVPYSAVRRGPLAVVVPASLFTHTAALNILEKRNRIISCVCVCVYVFKSPFHKYVQAVDATHILSFDIINKKTSYVKETTRKDSDGYNKEFRRERWSVG